MVASDSMSRKQDKVMNIDNSKTIVAATFKNMKFGYDTNITKDKRKNMDKLDFIKI